MTKDQPRTVLVTGMVSQIDMERGNLGNFVIVEPFLRGIREHFKNWRIVVTFALRTRFAAHAGVQTLDSRAFRSKRWDALISTVAAVVIAAGHALVRRVGGRAPRWLLRTNTRVRAIAEADLVLDFHGDMFGDNAHNFVHMFTAWSTPLIGDMVGTPVYCVASSPGPFGSCWRTWFARNAFKRYRMVATRDPVSLDGLRFLGLDGTNYGSFACPSFGFRPVPWATDPAVIMEREPRLSQRDRPVVGLILSDLNMFTLPAYKPQRDDREFAPFVRLVTSMVEDLGVRVCVISHQNRTNRDGDMVEGPDHRIVRRLVELVQPDVRDAVFTLRNVYDASEMNRIIGSFDMLVSGRIHGAVQGISQCIPTAIIDYGLPPPAHKLQGFARLAGLEAYLCRPHDAECMIGAVTRLWTERDEVRDRLARRVPALVAESSRLWDVILRDAQRAGRHTSAPVRQARRRAVASTRDGFIPSGRR